MWFSVIRILRCDMGLETAAIAMAGASLYNGYKARKEAEKAADEAKREAEAQEAEAKRRGAGTEVVSERDSRERVRNTGTNTGISGYTGAFGGSDYNDYDEYLGF